MRYGLVVWLWCLFASCSRSHSEAGGDSSTHWLKRCGGDDQCGGLSCVCGVCSSECSQSHECDGLGASAVCVAGATSECGGSGSAPLRLCDVTCQRDADCGSGLACVQQRCRGGAAEPLAQFDAGPAGSESDAGNGQSILTQDAGSAPDASAPPGAMVSQCAPQRAASDGTECLRPLGFAWNGARCEQVVCGCAGADCPGLDARQPTQSACEAAFASCRPMSVCSGLPWYQCQDYCPSRQVLHGGGRSFGECEGDCEFVLQFNPLTILDAGGCTELLADLTISNTDGSQRVVNMTLTTAAWQEMALLSLALDGAALEPVSGCPDCTDGGAAWIARGAKGSGRAIETFRYEYQRPPPGMQAYDRLVQQLIDQGRVCQGSLLERCGSYTAQPSPRCGSDLPIDNTTCDCSVPFAQLNSLKGTACSASCASCQVSASTCGATCIQPCAGGQPIWDTYCTE